MPDEPVSSDPKDAHLDLCLGYTPSESARRLNVSQQRVDAMIKHGVLDPGPIDGKKIIPFYQVHAYARAESVPGVSRCPEGYITVDNMAELLGVTPKQIMVDIGDGKLEAIYAAKTLCVEMRAAAEWNRRRREVQ